jgi:pimeloyl-ACP methyl ester carboxylesterase
MNLVDIGRGAPVVLIPGIQGRWEWARPAVEALGARGRVITFSLADEPSARARFDAGRGFANYVDQVESALDQAGLDRATICGVSYGGLVAAAFARHRPGRVAGLALVSALPPRWTPDARVQRYLRAPRLFTPAFCVGSLRLLPEIVAARVGVVDCVKTSLAHAGRAVRHPVSPRRMARRAEMTRGVEWLGIEHVRVPTLVVTGEASLDRVVPPAQTVQYLRLWPHAAHVTLPRTGHIGLVTRPTEFAAVVSDFAAAAARSTSDVDGAGHRPWVDRHAAGGEIDGGAWRHVG